MHYLMELASTILLWCLIAPHALAQQPSERADLISVGSAKKNPVIMIKTEYGDITAELYADKVAGNGREFPAYIREKKVHNPTFYRVVLTEPDNQPDKSVKIQVLQGGLTDVPDHELPTIKHETTEMTGIRHQGGVLSMARDEPGTATHHFSICIGDQPALDFAGNATPTAKASPPSAK